MDLILKLIQAGFYLIGATVAILTYVKAKNGLLNSVNTEYQKRVMDRLADLSEELYDEFDQQSDNFWVREDSVKEVLDRLHEDVIPHKHEIITKGAEIPGIPIPKKLNALSGDLNKIKSDPFIPKNIREKVKELIDSRVKAMQIAYVTEVEEYKKGLSEGKHWDSLETNHHWLHNRIMSHLNEAGCGISDLEEKVHDIRSDIQSYFESFNPIKP